MSAPEFTTAQLVAFMETGHAKVAESVLQSARTDLTKDMRASLADRIAQYRAIAARLSDPWSAFAGWQPPPEAERADGFRCQGWVDGEEVEWRDDTGPIPLWEPRDAAKCDWEIVTWGGEIDGEPMTGRWVAYGCIVEPTAFAPLPPAPKESTDD